jgi:hypothetical protein
MIRCGDRRCWSTRAAIDRLHEEFALAEERPRPLRTPLSVEIAATAHANHLDLYTRNGDACSGLEELVRVIEI